jgi:hypothetical protein
MRFTITHGIHGWQVFDNHINAPIGECYPTPDQAQTAADRDNQMYGDDRARSANRCDSLEDYAYELGCEDAFDRQHNDYYERHIRQ